MHAYSHTYAHTVTDSCTHTIRTMYMLNTKGLVAYNERLPDRKYPFFTIGFCEWLLFDGVFSSSFTVHRNAHTYTQTNIVNKYASSLKREHIRVTCPMVKWRRAKKKRLDTIQSSHEFNGALCLNEFFVQTNMNCWWTFAGFYTRSTQHMYFENQCVSLVLYALTN